MFNLKDFIVKKNVLHYLLVLVVIGFVGCTSNKKPKGFENDRLNVEIEEISKNKFESMFSAPSPEEIISLFEDSGLKYNSELLNKPSNVKNYLTSRTLNLNLGVYVADAAYLNMQKQYATMTNYLEAIFEITDKLEITGIYEEFDFKKVFTEMDNLDSLSVISEGVYHAITDYMINTGNEAALCTISFGSLIELLHLALESMPAFNENDEILIHIFDQSMQIENLYDYAMDYSDDTDIKIILNDLSKLMEVWNMVEHTDSETVVSRTEDGLLKISGGKKPKFTEEQFLQLKNTVKKIRSKITA